MPAQLTVSLDASLSVVFNGGIYNYGGMRRDLIAGEYEFRSNTDTGVASWLPGMGT
jgi:asparagine synthetase B (glutamine-hydrolysing)